MSNIIPRKCRVFRLPGFQSYEKVWKYQRALVEYTHRSRIKLGNNELPIADMDSIIVTQHKGVYTIGKGGTLDNLKDSFFYTSSKLYHTERGGEITWHGPGQMIAYPVIDLNAHKKDLRWYVRTLEESVIQMLQNSYDISSSRSHLNSGVWVNNNEKISAIGISASRWITMHGISINVNCQMSDGFNHIIPCGIRAENASVCSIAQLVQSKMNIDVTDVENRWLNHFKQILNIEYIDSPIGDLDYILRLFPHIENDSLMRINYLQEKQHVNSQIN